MSPIRHSEEDVCLFYSRTKLERLQLDSSYFKQNNNLGERAFGCDKHGQEIAQQS